MEKCVLTNQQESASGSIKIIYQEEILLLMQLPIGFFHIFCEIYMFWQLDMIEVHQERLEPMSVAHFAD